MRAKQYFKQNDGDPQPLSCEIEFETRFSELDPMNIVWHGNYAAYFEEGRLALGGKYGFSYMDFYNKGVIIPLKQIHFDYVKPLEFQKKYKLKTLLRYNEAARLDFEFYIYDSQNELATSGYSIQLMIDKKEGILVNKPPFFEEICRKWKENKL